MGATPRKHDRSAAGHDGRTCQADERPGDGAAGIRETCFWDVNRHVATGRLARVYGYVTFGCCGKGSGESDCCHYCGPAEARQDMAFHWVAYLFGLGRQFG
jgi:hypothetical protein